MEAIILLMVIAGIVGGVLQIVAMVNAAQQAAQNFHHIERIFNEYYDEPIRELYRNLGWAIQQRHVEAARNVERQIKQQIARIPAPQRRAHEQHLNDVVSENLTLNRDTGEFEDRRSGRS